MPMRGPAVAGGVSRLSLCALHRQRRKLRGYTYARTSGGGRSIEVVFMRIASTEEELRGYAYARTSGGGRSIEVVLMRIASTEEKAARLCLCADQRWREVVFMHIAST